ncbi:MAG: prephenate dehydrogenase/arogenate dehydrogenase family protein [Verrucomicrobia bacterium]|nr:MAG: prephenate dehydrogenase/arogenate dehydrogenase family protein [Verrucomicrobiota bacterium]
MEKVAIVGLGLMGGSLGLALKARGCCKVVAGYARREATRAEALRLKAVDAVFADPAEAVRGADLIVLCAPVFSLPALAAACRPGLRAGALVTDVGSTKAWLTEQIRLSLRGSNAVFVGSHPIAGSEQQGLAAALADLYQDAVTIVTSDGGESQAAVEKIGAFWRSVGSVVRVMNPAEHDRVMARTSHLPHVAAALVAATVGRTNGTEQIGAFCGPGFRDVTRVAEGSPEVWLDILQSNRPALAEELRALQDRLAEVLVELEHGNEAGLRQFLEDGRAARRALLAARSNHARGEV